MKNDLSEFVAKCPNSQQVKVEHQILGGLSQDIGIPTWKWEYLNMGFIVCLPRTRRQYDSIWVIVDRMRKLVHFIPSRYWVELGVDEVRCGLFFIAMLVDARKKSPDSRSCGSHIGWFEVGEIALIGPELVHEAMEKVWLIGERLKMAESLQKSYTNVRRIDLEFEEEVPIEISDRQVSKLRNKEVASVKVLWRNQLVEGATWESEADMISLYPHLFHSNLPLA
ncbi:hypothetical protein MTR67_018214 [Solanum verrucosum]|uniref:Uncharacterized protein n=1 Tax=Solanum verrucosum TaxID=315347 RepID=A0AAF0QRS0_SOLVR|nr:hypothetical protein MTR67_018214 [Solanum verrucosum]